nr:MAG: hypothetical protein KatS3mg041_0537 [Bacteroidota bacterium]
MERASELGGRGRYAEAALLYGNAARLFAQTGRREAAVIAYDSLGQCLMRQSRFWEALEAYNAALQLDLSYLRAYLAKARLYLDTRQPRNALTALEEAEKLAPDHLERLQLLGRVYLMLGQPAEAAQVWKHIIRLDPRPERQLARCMVLEAWREQLQQLQAPDSLHRTVALELGHCYLAAGEPEKAALYFQEAMRKLTPEPFLGLARARLAQGNRTEAQAVLEQAIGLAEQAPDPAAVYRQLAELFDAAGAPDRAVRMRQRALEKEIRQQVQRSAVSLQQAYERSLFWWQLETGYGWWMRFDPSDPLQIRSHWQARQTYWNAQLTVRILRSPLQAGLGYSQDGAERWQYLYGSLGVNFTDPYEAFSWVLVPAFRYGANPRNLNSFTYEFHLLLGIRLLFLSLGGELVLHRPLPDEAAWRALTGAFLRLHLN